MHTPFATLTSLFVSSLLLLGFAVIPVTGEAQTGEQAVRESLAEARNALAQLDRLGEACLADAAEAEACAAFQQALDGDLLTIYVDSCTIARSWRDEFVANRINAGNRQDPDAGDGNNLQNLVEVEFWCGADGLAQASDYVVPAYTRIKTTRDRAGTRANALQYQLDSARQTTLLNRERTRLSDDRANQRYRARQQTLRQWQQLELELIRQQRTLEFRRLPQ